MDEDYRKFLVALDEMKKRYGKYVKVCGNCENKYNPKFFFHRRTLYLAHDGKQEDSIHKLFLK